MIQLALGFAFLGGYCDAISFFLVGTFTGHVTGNSVLAAMPVALFDARGTLACSLAILFFLAGTFLGARLAQTLAGRSERFILQATTGVEVALILVGYLAVSGTSPIRSELYIAVLALAMGLQNGAFRRANGLTVHTTCVSACSRMSLRISPSPARSPQVTRPIQNSPRNRSCLAEFSYSLFSGRWSAPLLSPASTRTAFSAACCSSWSLSVFCGPRIGERASSRRRKCLALASFAGVDKMERRLPNLKH